MLVKDIVKVDDRKKNVRKGDAVLYTPNESFPFAVEYGVRSQNTMDRVYWVLRDSIQVATTHHAPDGKGGWKATGSGTAKIGYTDAKTDQFYDAIPYSFTIEYESGKDSLGLPDIRVTSFKPTSLSSNPSDLMGFDDPTPAPQSAVTPKVQPKIVKPQKVDDSE